MPQLSEPSRALTAINEHIELREIRARELFCVREEVEDPEEQPRFALQVDLTNLEDLEPGEPRPFRYGLKLELETPDGRTRVAVEGRYTVAAEHAASLDMALAVEYANHVALMALLPYVRQALTDLSNRVLDNQILMPIFQRGAISFDPPADAG